MAWRIDEIKIANFKAFAKEQTIPIGRKNLLLYGDNGSGKSSIFWSLYTLYQSCYKKDRAKVSKYFEVMHEQNLQNRHVSENASCIVATFKDDCNPANTKTLKLSNDNFDIVGSTDEFTVATSTFSDFFNYQKQSSLFDYCNSEDNDVFKPFLRDMFPFIHLNRKLVKIDGTEVDSDTALDAWNYLVEAVNSELVNEDGTPVSEDNEKYQNYENALMQFNRDFDIALKGIESKVKMILSDKMELSNISLIFDYEEARFNVSIDALNMIKDRKLHPGRILVSAEDCNIEDEAKKIIKHPRTYFNEATLSKIALAIRLAVFEMKGSFVGGEGAKLLFVDDLLVTFDMKNRMDIIKIILSYANDYQLIVFTHDRTFYNMVKGIIADMEMQKKWVYDNIYMVHQFGLSYPTPKIIEEKSYMDMAKKYFEENDCIACAVYLRKETERIAKSLLELRYICSEGVVLGKFPTINLADLLDNLKKEFDDCKLSFDFIKLNVLRRDVMNISVHDDAYSPIYRNELAKAIGLVEELGKIKRKVICNEKEMETKKFDFHVEKQVERNGRRKPKKEIDISFKFHQTISKFLYLGKEYYPNVKIELVSSAVFKHTQTIPNLSKNAVLGLHEFETKVQGEFGSIDLSSCISYKNKKLKKYLNGLEMENEEQIRLQLQQLLESHSKNYSQILLLSNKLAEFDKEHVRFSIDGGLIDRLGNELVARQETAVSELVKNCYDADATHVTLTFRNTDKIGGELLIEDNGTGMTEQQLRDGFMRISSSEKIKNPVSAIYHRKRAGKKGIGRFSVQRLGRKLIIQTFTASANTGFELCIDWNSYAENKELGFVSNTIKSIPKCDFVGTRLLIKDLRDRWPEASISRIYQYVSDVIQPHDIFRTKKENNSVDTGMEVLFYLNNKNIHKEIHDLKLSYNQMALATIEGGVDSERHGYYHVYSDKLKLDFTDNVGYDTEDKYSEFRNIKNLKFKAYYFIYQKNLIPHGQMTSIKKYALNNSGIKLYRNGFRVLPYGERGDDWLSLDLSTRRRSILPTHTNQNFFGFVEISDDSGDFEETSSREGLLNNDAFVELQNFIYRALVNAVVKIAEVRNVKIVSGQKKENGTWEDINVRIKNIFFTLSELDKELATADNTVEARRKRQKAIANLKKEVDEVDKLQKKAQKKQIKDTAMLRVLGSVGLTVGQFIHEVKNHFININKEVDLLNNVTVIQDVHQHTAVLSSNFRDLNTYVSYFDKVISDNVVRELRPLDLRSEIGRFVNSMEEDLKRVGIELVEPIIHGYFLYTVPMHPSELSSVLFNFYTNSRKAIKRANSNGKIMIECGTSGDIVYLEFSDNGDGVSKEIEDRIFDEFFTTTSASSLDSIDSTNEVTGTGLGLSIVRDIVKSYRGTVRVVSPKSNYSTCIRVEFPKATKKHLQDYIYE